MKRMIAAIVALSVTLVAAVAYAYELDCKGDCCDVWCNGKKMKAGNMCWNGSVWTDGVKSDPDKDAEAKKIVAANGTACQ